MVFSQIKRVFLKKTTLSADKVGLSLINLVYLRKSILSAPADKVGENEKQHADNMDFHR